MKEKYKSLRPGLAIIQVGNREDSNIYVRHKIKAANQVGMQAFYHKYKTDITESELLLELSKLNDNPTINGIIVQLPFDSADNINADLITDNINPAKDVDGLHFANIGKLIKGNSKDGFIPCTPKACLELIKSTGVCISGQNAVVVGRSNLVGTPMANLLMHHDATVTVCHSQTKNIPDICRTADILVVAIGKAKFITKEMIKPGAVVIDCGINNVTAPGIFFSNINFSSTDNF
jgi:methylenetetrahydrofolate dehydrogenase (NADP+)/methenyltetrahydrofolate cyclohydrolase/formyltetrahydrofolate synthetase